MAGALEGVRVLDLTRLLPGGFCTLLLADLGADVLKVEDTAGGDYIRWMPPYYGGEAERQNGTASAYFLALNRNKRSVRLDLKDERGRDALLRLVEDYDVVVEGFRPGVMDRLSVGYEALRARNPRVIYCAISGYGQTGPLTDRSGHDTNYLALAGLLGLTGPRSGPPIQSAGQIADLGGGGLMAAVGILAAVIERERSGEGQIVDISMTDGALSWLAMVIARFFAEQTVPRRGDLELAGGIACYFPYETKDNRWVSLGALEPKFWQNWCAGVERSDLIEKQFVHPDSEDGAEVAAVFRERTRDEWAAFAGEHDCCLEPILDLDEALESDVVRARNMVVELDQPGIGKVKQVGAPIKLSRTPADTSGPAPALGGDTDAVLREIGMA
jgi:alpha-methylacyl-CoA racemase